MSFITFYCILSSLLVCCLARQSKVEREETLIKLAQKWRKIAGELSCQVSAEDSIGPTGGWCLRDSRPTDYSHQSWASYDDKSVRPANQHVPADAGLAKTIVKYISPNSSPITLIDIGAGVGQYGAWFSKHAPQITWSGFDGAANVDSFTNGRVKWTDATVPYFDTIPFTADWVMSLEVGEHIPPNTTSQFIKTLVRHAKKGIILSWAIPGQGMIECIHICVYLYDIQACLYACCTYIHAYIFLNIYLL